MKRSKKGLIIGICALVLVLVAGTVAGILLMGKNSGKPEDTKHHSLSREAPLPTI